MLKKKKVKKQEEKQQEYRMNYTTLMMLMSVIFIVLGAIGDEKTREIWANEVLRNEMLQPFLQFLGIGILAVIGTTLLLWIMFKQMDKKDK